MLGQFKQSSNPSINVSHLDASVASATSVLPGLSDALPSSNSFSGSSSSTTSVIQGTLDSTDLSNPTRSGTVSDDYLLTDLVVGQQVTIKLNASFDTYLQIINAETGDVMYSDDDSGFRLNARVSFTAEESIDYIVRATSFGEGITGDYKLKTNAGFAIPASPISNSQTIYGALSATDATSPNRLGSYSDGYLLTGASAGEVVQVNLDSASFDTYLQVLNADTGDIVAFNDDFNGLNSQLEFTVEEGINYIIQATSFSADITGDYTITTSSDDSLWLPISDNETLTGTLSATDLSNPDRIGTYFDGYLLTDADVGEVIQVNLNASAFDTYLQVLNADTGEIVVFNDDFNGLNAQVEFTVEEGIDYIIRATSYGAGATGDYTLTTSSSEDGSWLPISDNQTLNGTLSATDPNNPDRSGSYFDGYLLTGADVGEIVQVNLDATAFDTYLQVLNADTGEIIVFNDDSNGLNAQVLFTVEEGIDYIIRATSYSAGAVGNYTISTNTVTIPEGFDINYGYGMVDAAAAVANALGESNPFPNVPNLGGDNWGLDMVNAPEVWAQGYTGEGIVVAVIDTGVDYTHSDLDANIWVNDGEIAGNGLDDDGNGYVDDFQGWDFADSDNNVMDLNGHGTHVAGTIAAENNNFGVTGVAYNAQIMPVRVLDAGGYGSWTDVANGIYYAANNGADVINMSLGGGYSSEVAAAVEYAAGLGVVVVMASGNEYSSQPGFPANLADEWGIAVGAVNSSKTLADFSNDAGTTPLNYVVAPGVDVLSTTPGENYQYFSGTSMATPHVAGVAALVLSANSELSADEVESIITETANPDGITV